MIGGNSFRFLHLGVAVPNLDRALEDYQNLFGYRLISGPFEDPVQRVKVCFVGPADGANPVIELIAPLGETSPILRLLAAGGGAYHICYEVGEIDSCIADLRSKKCALIQSPTPAVAFGGRRIAWLYTPSRQLVELVEGE